MTIIQTTGSGLGIAQRSSVDLPNIQKSIDDLGFYLELAKNYMGLQIVRDMYSDYDELNNLQNQIESMAGVDLDQISSQKLIELIDRFDNLSKTPVNQSDDGTSPQEIFKLFQEPLKFKLLDVLYKEEIGAVRDRVNSIYQNPGDSRGAGIKGHLDIQTPSPLIGSLGGEQKTHHLISDTNAVVKISQQNFHLGVGVGDVLLGTGAYKGHIGREDLQGFDTFERYWRDHAWGTIHHRLNRKQTSHIFNKPLDTVLRELKTKGDKLMEAMRKLSLCDENLVELPEPQWNYPFKVSTTHVGNSFSWNAMNKVFHGGITHDTQRGICYYHGDSLLQSLLEKKELIYSEEATKMLDQKISSELGRTAQDIQRDLNRFDGKVFGQDKFEEYNKELDKLAGELRQTIESQLNHLQKYYDLVRAYDSLKSDPHQKERCKELRKQKHALEQTYGIRGRGDFILRSCLHFAKAVHVYKRILNQKEFGSWERDDFYLSLQDKQKLLESPEISLNRQQIKRAKHIAIKTPVHWDRVSTNLLTIDLNSFGAPCKLEVKIDFHDVQRWGVPELEGQYFEITTSLNAAVPAAYSLSAAAAAYAVNKIQGFVRKKYNYSLGDISRELQDTLNLLDSHIPPTAAGVSAVNLFQIDSASNSLQLLYTRLLGQWGHEAGMRAGASGTVAGGWNAHVRDGKNLGEKLGTGTLKYLWRQFSGHFNNNNPEAWKKFVNRQGLFPIKPAIDEIFHNILKEGHPAKQSYDAFMKGIETHIERTVNGDKKDFEDKRAAFEEAIRRIGNAPSEEMRQTRLDEAIKAFENLFMLNVEGYWRNTLANMYTFGA